MTAKLISRIEVKDLFGLYTYVVPAASELENAAILYGDNGVGKSTLLRLVFHLLSAANNRGHRTALYRSEFSHLEVSLSTGVRLVARVATGAKPVKLLRLEVMSGEKKLAVWDYHPREESRYLEDVVVYIDSEGRRRRILQERPVGRRGSSKAVPQGQEAYLEALKLHVPVLFILNADRRLDSDSVADPSDEVELRRTMQYGEPKRINELVARSREIALSQALGAAWRWISQKAVLGTNQGAMNVHQVYGEVLRHVVSSNSQTSENVSAGAIVNLLKKLERIDVQSSEHARYELATHLDTNTFREALSGGADGKSILAAKLLEPYVKSVEGRLEAIDPIYQLIDRFVTIINELLSDKEISFKLSQGFEIKNRLKIPLEPAQLSSGEQQLLLLFCYVLTARDAPTVFMIDEPEISLNIKWQRQLIQSLLNITKGASIQFIFASHSMELLAQHKNNVVKLMDNS